MGMGNFNLRNWLVVLFVLSSSVYLQAQQQTLRFLDGESREPLMHVLISHEGKLLQHSDADGYARIALQGRQGYLKASLFGYRDTLIRIRPDMPQEVLMRVSEKHLGTLVVSENRYIAPLEKQTVSMEVVKVDDLLRKVSTDLTRVAERLPGLNILDGQASIRGGSGYAFGAGSRVLLVVDDQPLITADRNDIKWNFVPLEMTQQIEVLKSAASVQYGSAALNGVIHVRTLWPDSGAMTRISGICSGAPEPASEVGAWWGNQRPFQLGTSVMHCSKLGKHTDLVLSSNVFRSESWLQGEFEDRMRMSFKLRRRFKEGKITAGLQGNVMRQKNGFFLFWKGDSTQAYLPFSEGTNLDFNDLWLNVDPSLMWFDRLGLQHNLRGRFYYTRQMPDGPATALYNADYQVRRSFAHAVQLNAGIMTNHFRFVDDALGGAHSGNMAGIFIQLQKQWERLELSAGWRYEMFRLDTLISKSIPVSRFGLNYRLGSRWHLRASYGEGFRFPSPAERYVSYAVDLIQLYPNPELQAERGWNAELGMKKGFRVKDWMAWLDWAIFHAEYQNMTEFAFGKYGTFSDPLFGAGFKSINLTQARIAGVELSAQTSGRLGGHEVQIHAGYTYLCPIDLSVNDSLRDIGRFYQFAVRSFQTLDASANSPFLRYRYRHMVKANADVETRWGFTLGAGMRAYSFMEKVDTILATIIPNLATYRAENPKGTAVFDVRIGWRFSERHQLSVQVLNVANTFLAIRPAKPEAPRTFLFQFHTTLLHRRLRGRSAFLFRSKHQGRKISS